MENPVARNGLLKDYDKAEQLYRKATKAYAKGELPMTAPSRGALEAALEAGVFSGKKPTSCASMKRWCWKCSPWMISFDGLPETGEA